MKDGEPHDAVRWFGPWERASRLRPDLRVVQPSGKYCQCGGGIMPADEGVRVLRVIPNEHDPSGPYFSYYHRQCWLNASLLDDELGQG